VVWVPAPAGRAAEGVVSQGSRIGRRNRPRQHKMAGQHANGASARGRSWSGRGQVRRRRRAGGEGGRKRRGSESGKKCGRRRKRRRSDRTTTGGQHQHAEGGPPEKEDNAAVSCSLEGHRWRQKASLATGARHPAAGEREGCVAVPGPCRERRSPLCPEVTPAQGADFFYGDEGVGI